MPGFICVWQTYGGSNRVLFTLHLSQKLCVGMTRCTGRCTGQPTNLRYLWGVSFCHAAKFWYLNGGWFLIFLEHCLSGAGTLSLAWSPSSTESGLVNQVGSGLISLCCFDGEVRCAFQSTSSETVGQHMHSSLLALEWIHYYQLHPQNCCLHPAPGYGLISNRTFLCRAWLCPSLSMGCTTYTGRFG